MRLAPLLLALAACAPLPESGGRALTAEGVRPGVGAAHDLAAAQPPMGIPLRYQARNLVRDRLNTMEVVFAPAEGGYTRTETIRIPESSAPAAALIAAMVRQREGRAAEVDGSDVLLRAIDRTDTLGRTLASDRGGLVFRWKPHDCRATPGDCRTTRTGPGSRPEHLIVTSTETGGVWREQVRRDPSRDPQGRTTLLAESYFSLDQGGVLIDMNRLDHERDLGNYQEIRRVD